MFLCVSKAISQVIVKFKLHQIKLIIIAKKTRLWLFMMTLNELISNLVKEIHLKRSILFTYKNLSQYQLYAKFNDIIKNVLEQHKYF